MKFEVGEIVVINACKHGHGFKIGEKVRITDVRKVNYCAESLDRKDRWAIEDDEISPVKQPFIVISKRNREVMAEIKEGKKVVKSAKATCNLSDEFDFEVGAKLAFKRLMGEGVNPDVNADGYKIGDKVKALIPVGGLRINNAIGEVFDFDTDCSGKEIVCVKFYCNINGGTGKHTKEKHCWNVYSYNLVKIVFREVERPAKVGDWIKVVNSIACDHVGYNNGEILKVESLYRGYEVQGVVEKPYHIVAREYVVLENYQPDSNTESKPFVKAKVGDKIEIINAMGGHGPIVKNGDVFMITSIDDYTVKTSHNVFFDEDAEYIIAEEAPRKPLSDFSIEELLTEIKRRMK